MSDVWVSQMRKGLLEMCLLAALRRGETYGYALMQSLRAVQGLSLADSTVYPLLARMSQEGLVAVRRVESTQGPPRRYYRLTLAGQDRLEHMIAHWEHLCSGIASLVRVSV